MSAVLAGARVPTILVVDDSVAVRQLTVGVLRREGFVVLEAGDGREGLDTALRELAADLPPRLEGLDAAGFEDDCLKSQRITHAIRWPRQ